MGGIGGGQRGLSLVLRPPLNPPSNQPPKLFSNPPPPPECMTRFRCCFFLLNMSISASMLCLFVFCWIGPSGVAWAGCPLLEDFRLLTALPGLYTGRRGLLLQNSDHTEGWAVQLRLERDSKSAPKPQVGPLPHLPANRKIRPQRSISIQFNPQPNQSEPCAPAFSNR